MTKTNSFAGALEAVTPQAAGKMLKAIETNLADRAVFEEVKNPENANIHRTLKKVREGLVRDDAARVFVATNVEASILNRTINDGARYNVYAMGKLEDFVRALSGRVWLTNKINQAIWRSFVACHKAGVPFTIDVAKAAASDKIRIEPVIAKHLSRHTVSASTAPTQASSTMQALLTLGICVIEGSRKNPTYKLMESAPQTKALMEIAEAA